MISIPRVQTSLGPTEVNVDVEVRIPPASIPGFTVGAALEPVRFPGRSTAATQDT